MSQIAIFVVLSAIFHALLLRFPSRRIYIFATVVLGSALAVLAFQLWAYWELGHLDPFFQVAATLQFGLALLTGVVVALVVRKRREN